MVAASERPRPGAIALPLTALAAGLGVYGCLAVAVILATGGTFEYPLDDPYIHLALAEQIAQGTYGINPGERASPGSSPAFPLLLTPFAGLPVQRFLPAFWNLVGLAASGWLWGRLLVGAGYGRAGWRWLGFALAALGPAILLMPQVAFLGMEHGLQAAAALAVVLGLYRHLESGGRGGVGLVAAGVLLGSAMRFEALALGLLAAGVLVLTGRRLAGAVTAVFALLPLLAFVGFLMALGLDPMPSSVQVKLGNAWVGADNPVAQVFIKAAWNVLRPGGLLVAGVSVALLALWRLSPALRVSQLRWLAAAAAAAGAAHLVAGDIGWLNRYEHYVVLVTVASLVALLPMTVSAAPPGAGFLVKLAPAFVAALVIYQPLGTSGLVISARAVHNQQGEMARFARDYLDAPVAVNDIGRVAWRNPNYVLDLWGLASGEARKLRRSDPGPGWTETLTAAHDVPAAMIYDRWFGDGIGADWVRLGQLELTVPSGYIGDYKVGFFATAPDHVDTLSVKLDPWIATLGPGARFVWDDGQGPGSGSGSEGQGS